MFFSDDSMVEYGLNSLNQKQAGPISTKFVDGGNEKRVMFIHHVVVKNLVPGKKYIYHVGKCHKLV